MVDRDIIEEQKKHIGQLIISAKSLRKNCISILDLELLNL
jgi:hypothetical protein